MSIDNVFVIWHISSRTRLEHRFINRNSGIAWRLRQQLLAKFRISCNEKIRPVIFDEIFFNLNHPKWVSNSTINQNRILLGCDVYFSEKNFIRIGYMNRYATAEPKNMMFHILWLAVHIKIN